MSERILKALIQLFAIIARVDPGQKEDISGREIVESFLQERLPSKHVSEYLALFESYLESYQKVSDIKDGKRKRTAVNSVKVLRICTQINEELTQRQKTIVLIRLLEFVYTHDEVNQDEEEFVNTVASTFHFDMNEYTIAQYFVQEDETELIESPLVMYITDSTDSGSIFGKHLLSPGMEGYIRVLRLPSVNLHFIKYMGPASSYNISGQLIVKDRFYVLNQGAAIRGPKIKPIYYSDIISSFLSDDDTEKISFRARDVQFKFKAGNIGLHPIDIEEDGGKLIGIMGGSGSGKSTLINVLNGNLKPHQGRVLLNGIDVHTEGQDIEGLIGYVAQDDLLIEELTVFQNLYYNARLCFGRLEEEEIRRKVEEMLSSLGLSETRDLKVGNPLDKTISGGQRKRLNIALELIREPAVLFIDEPTSGLSSRDSENIMDLLKELSLKGKMIFVVIHQPSADIFKMFDRLMLLDQGGFPIYYGNPVDSVMYFRKAVHHVNSDEAECDSCGHIKTEEIFNIIEAKVVDEFGNLTHERKMAPQEWNRVYLETIKAEKMEAEESPVVDSSKLPGNQFTVPGKLKQFGVFLQRDLLSKLTNKQYVLINLIEAPALAMILAFFMRFFSPGGHSEGYVFRENENIPVYIFISVIVALFIGLTVSSEEIIRDKKIRQREAFLNLSRSSYLWSKISVLFGISALQMFLFVLIGNAILEIEGMNWSYWAILFSTCAFANVLGLNISASFNSAKVIYILIPIFIIPQLLFSGIIVKFDRLNPIFASQSGVPWIGNIMASRWAYEALAVNQFKSNEYEKEFYEYERQKKHSNWKKDYWVTTLKNKTGQISRMLNDEGSARELEYELTLMRNELGKENKFLSNLRFKRVNELTPEQISPELVEELKLHLQKLTEHYRKVYLRADSEKEKAIYAMTNTEEGNQIYRERFNRYKNDQLELFATNKNDLNHITEHQGELIQKKDLIYLLPYNTTFFGSHFYAPAKPLNGRFIDTFAANMLVIWGMTILFILCLFGNVFPKLVHCVEHFTIRKPLSDRRLN